MAWELNSDRPIYAQILEKLQVRIVCGIYRPGEWLPSVRDLAAEASVNPNTMQRAFMELERSGLVTTQRNMGRVVTQDTQLIANAKHQMAVTQMNSFFANMRQLGYSDNEIISLINQNANTANTANNADNTMIETMR